MRRRRVYVNISTDKRSFACTSFLAVRSVPVNPKLNTDGLGKLELKVHTHIWVSARNNQSGIERVHEILTTLNLQNNFA
jgi:hypothetical protein